MEIKNVNLVFFFYFISLGFVLLGVSNTISNTVNPGVGAGWQIDPSLLIALLGITTIVVSGIFFLATLRSKEIT